MNHTTPPETFNVITSDDILFSGTYEDCMLYCLECSERTTAIAETSDIDVAREWLKNFSKIK